MPYQFIHVESYGKTSPKKAKTPKPTADSVLHEAARDEGYTPHIEHPKPPIVLHGSIESVREAIDKYIEGTRDAKGRKLRSDANVLLAGVISFPREYEEDWPLFRQKSLEWLQKKYGDKLRAVVEHTDEAHPHLHFYCVEHPGNPYMLHPGTVAFKAAEKAAAAGKKINKQFAANKALREYQDDFWKSVSFSFGLSKLGPKRQRLTRAEWKAQNEEASRIRKINQIVEKRVEEKLQRKIEEMESGLIGKVKLGLMALHTPTLAAIEKIKKKYEDIIKNLEEKINDLMKIIRQKNKEIEKLREDLRQTNNFHNAALTRATSAEKKIEKLNKIIEQQDEKIDQLNNTLKKHGIRVIKPSLESNFRQTRGIEL